MSLYLRYNSPAEDSDEGWEKSSIPLGCGYMGACVFGIPERDRIQITENSLVNPGLDDWVGRGLGGLNNFAEIYIEFPHQDVENYVRTLCLDRAVAETSYTFEGVEYKREYFTSYPDKVLVVHLTASKEKALSFRLIPTIPFVKPYARTEGDGGGKSGKVTVKDHVACLRGMLNAYQIVFEGQIKVISDGEIIDHDDSIEVRHASEACFVLAVGTNYKLCSEVFLNDDRSKKIYGEDPHEKVSRYLDEACEKDYQTLYQRHIEDFSSYFGRVSLKLGEAEEERATDVALLDYQNTRSDPALEALYFQYGRYLLISASRPGCLPANLQGIWNCHDQSPWGAGYWHNINVQMNYWPAFSCNLAEMFEPYVDYFNAFYPRTCQYAEERILQTNPSQYKKGECGYIMGTTAYPYYICKSSPTSHSGPGTGALTSILFWDYYDFTRNVSTLRNVSYKALKGMSDLLTKCVKNYDGEYYVTVSASPEQNWNAQYLDRIHYYQTVGCAFDQQLMEENARAFIKASEILSEDNETLRVQKEQAGHYNPVQIGWSGQVKEYIEENFYGEIGEYHHRHISHLMALHPGTIINSDTEAWIDAAKYSLTERGDESTGWALAHRLNAWARTGDGNHAHKLLAELLANRTNANLWDEHPPFQIDGNFGATAGIAEMLLQSHEGYISPLPALPDSWSKGSFSGLCARGAFEVGIEWSESTPRRMTLLSKVGGEVSVKMGANAKPHVTSKGEEVPFSYDGRLLTFRTAEGEEYEIVGFALREKPSLPENFSATQDLVLTWDGGAFDVFRAVDGAPTYEKIAENVLPPYRDDFDFSKAEIITYKVGRAGHGVSQTVNHSTELQRDIYRVTIGSKYWRR